MKNLIQFLLAFIFIEIVHANSSVPDQLMSTLLKGVSDRNGIIAADPEKDQEFDEFLLKNWQLLFANIDYFPEIRGSKYSALSDIGNACEKLPAMEYLVFLEKYLLLIKENNIDPGFFKERLIGANSKTEFFTVNYEHPRVRKLLEEAKSIFQNDPESVILCDHLLSGENADEYLYGISESAPLPETLPGIKLKKPFEKLRKQVEQLTGKKVPDDEYDARWKEYDRQWRMRYEREKRGEKVGDEPTPPKQYESAILPYALYGVAGLGIPTLLCAWLIKARKARSKHQ